MKKQFFTVIVLCSIILLTACNLQNFKKTIGAKEWDSYRLNIENNPVITNGKSLKLTTKLKTDNQLRATPIVSHNTLFVGNHMSGSFQAFDLTNGKRLWKTKLPNWIHSQALYQNGKIYVGYGNRYFKNVNGQRIRGTNGGGVASLDAKTGKILWNFKINGEVMPTPVLYKNDVIITGGDQILHAVNKKTGQQDWSYKTGTVVSMSSPTIQNHILYYGSNVPFTFIAFNLNTKKPQWETKFPKVIDGLDDVPPVIYKNNVITTALTGDPQHPTHMIYAMDKKTGKIKWKENMGRGNMVKYNKSGAPIIYKGNVYVASPITKKMYAYNASTGKRLWSKQNDAVMKAPPVATNHTVYFADKKGRIIGLNDQTGKQVGVKQLHGKLAPAGPIIVDNEMIVGSQDSNIYIFPLNSIK